MLKKLVLTNFRAARERTVNFTAGLNVLRGENEAGKSTLLEAWRYALFGSRALKQPFADVVTHGEKETSLRVEAHHVSDGREIVFSRGKGGAEVYIDGHHEPFITGQTEVTKFATEMLGADLDTVNQLMMANQGNLRGALEKGPTEAAKMIEDLADFTLFDTLIDRAAKELVLGSDTTLRDRVARIEQAQASASESSTDPHMIDMLQDSIGDKEAQVSDLEKSITETLEPALAAATAALAGAKRDRSDYDKAVNAVAQAKAKVDATIDAGTDASLIAGKRDEVQASLDELKQKLEAANAMANAAYAWSVFQKLPNLETEWEGDRASLDAEIAAVQAKVDEYSQTLATVQGKFAQARASIITDTVCPTCKRPLEDHESIEQANAHAQEVMAQMEQAEKNARADLVDAREELAELRKVAQAGDTVQAALASSQYMVEVGAFVPAHVKWVGPVIDPNAETADALQRKLNGVEAQMAKVVQAEADHQRLKAALDVYDKELERAESELASMGHPKELNVLIENERDADNALANARQKVRTLHKEISEAKVEIARVEMQQAEAERAANKLAEDLAQAQKDLESLAFNNALVKKIRACRPAVSDKLWSMISGAVSAMFSQMRGKHTVITKGKDGFRADGESIVGLSGSTLDALGLAIRVCLIRTFVPHCPFLFLDEPFAAADEGRSAAMLGFVQACGFEQSLIITHEDISEGVADNLIVLE